MVVRGACFAVHEVVFLILFLAASVSTFSRISGHQDHLFFLITNAQGLGEKVFLGGMSTACK
jgi:hypothetical protein